MIERERRFEIMAAGPAEPLVALADRLLEQDGTVEILKQPRPGVLMLRARDTAQGEVFNFGEAIVTEAEVRYSGQTGYMLILGSDQTHALAGAICDAALEAKHPLTPDILEVITLLNQLQQERAEQEWAKVAPTSVNFDEMEA